MKKKLFIFSNESISVEDDKKAKRIKEIMESAVELEIPNKVDYEKGTNRGDIK